MRPIIVAFALLIASLPAAADPPSMETLYHYRAVIKEVIDGNSVAADMDLGFSIWRHGERFELARIDAPAASGATQAAGEAARDFLKNLIEGKQVLIHSIVDPEQEGRYLADIWLDGANVNDQLVAAGHAVEAHD
jgi:endonuclease YncB( thermonuclease family)